MNREPPNFSSTLGRWRSLLALSVLAWLVLLPFLVEGEPESKDVVTRATCFLLITRSTDFPERVFSDANAPFVIGIIGTDPFGDTLDKLATGTKACKRPIVIRRFSNPSEVVGCHVLFISDSEERRLPEIFKSIQDRSVLTIGELDRFVERSGIVRLVKKPTTSGSATIGWEINQGVADRAKISLNSKVLANALYIKK
jgi:hypothetical protein